MKHLILIQCSKSKLDHRAQAYELYDSDLFKKSLYYAWDHNCKEAIETKEYAETLILSALHGVVDPFDRLDPYDVALCDMTKQDRVTWSLRVYHQLKTRFGFALPEKITFLAGVLYREHLEHLVREYDGVKTEVPMKGLGIGQQKHWLMWETERVREQIRNLNNPS